MLFHSLEFLLFYAVIVVLCFAWPTRVPLPRKFTWWKPRRTYFHTGRHRWVLLLAASYYFYAAWAREFLVWIVASTLIAYVSALLIDNSENASRRKAFLWLGIGTSLSLLIFTKYSQFLLSSAQVLVSPLSGLWNRAGYAGLMPIGISFYTLQTIGYVIDVYRGRLRAERHLGRLALFVSFFPQLVAGPIERAGDLLPQFERRRGPDPSLVGEGLRLMLWGMLKKVVIADRLALYVNGVYDHPTEYQGLAVMLSTLFFAIQIYCDFSGYSDIALGVARVMGYDLTQNFERPYFSTSIAAFWRRWHISLSGWFRDYLYIPLGGNRVGKWRWVANVLIVFLVSGLWHGANWTFVLWGGLHGLYYLVEEWTKEARMRIPRRLGVQNRPRLGAAVSGVATFALVCFAWVFFRANSVSDAFLLIGGLFRRAPVAVSPGASGATELPMWLAPWGARASSARLETALSFALLTILGLVDWVRVGMDGRPGAVRPLSAQAWTWIRALHPRCSVYARWAIYLLLALAVLNLGVSRGTPFVYMQF
jgi:D-alanyl-lipoteichoic acid acyltransferase DltB (MBOAT superfamily)